MKPRRALITGGASGFGLSTAKALLAQGAQVAITDIDGEKLRAANDELHSDRVLALVLDVTSPASVQQTVAACQTRFGGLDALVNSAGVIHFGSLAETTEADWDRVIDIDLKGVFLCCQAAAPLLRQSGQHGRIVNIGSDVSKIGCALIASYCAAKFGVVGLSKALAGELAPAGVTVNCVCPVGVSTTGHGPRRARLQTTGDRRGQPSESSPRRRRTSHSAATPPRTMSSTPSCFSSLRNRPF